jgi:hypothetical protein
VAPCACSGSMRFIHPRCLQRWITEKGDAVCEVCQQPFQGEWEVPRPMRFDERAEQEQLLAAFAQGMNARLRPMRMAPQQQCAPLLLASGVAHTPQVAPSLKGSSTPQASPLVRTRNRGETELRGATECHNSPSACLSASPSAGCVELTPRRGAVSGRQRQTRFAKVVEASISMAMMVRRESLGFVPRSRAIFYRAVPNPKCYTMRLRVCRCT